MCSTKQYGFLDVLFEMGMVWAHLFWMCLDDAVTSFLIVIKTIYIVLATHLNLIIAFNSGLDYKGRVWNRVRKVSNFGLK